MNEKSGPERNPSAAGNDKKVNAGAAGAGQKPATPTSKAEEPAAADAIPVNDLTPEEQMALYEKELKENDWGHQPC